MAFFTADFTSASLFFAWSQHQTELRSKRLQPHNDFLYEVVKDSILSRREELSADLLVATSTALTPQGLSIPLWTYNAASYDAPRTSLDAIKLRESEELLRRRGYQWFIGLVPEGETPDVRYDDDGWDSTWRWHLPQPVHDVVRNTDFLQRLTLLFGVEDFRITYSILSEKYLTEPLPVRLMEVELRLHYYPMGAPPGVAAANRRAHEKYETHEPASSPWLMPFISEGLSEDDSDHHTPPGPVRLLCSAPVLPQRSNGGGIRYCEEADALQRTARDLSADFNSADVSVTVPPPLARAPAGQYIYYETGPDGQRTCHCHCSDDEE